jgi:hypothetical protein
MGSMIVVVSQELLQRPGQAACPQADHLPQAFAHALHNPGLADIPFPGGLGAPYHLSAIRDRTIQLRDITNESPGAPHSCAKVGE